MNYTTNYHLPQWAETDRIMMEDFNDAMSDIDQGIKTAQSTADTAESKADAAQTAATAAQTTAGAAYCPTNKPYMVGKYTGSGSSQEITIGFKPTIVIITGENYYSSAEINWQHMGIFPLNQISACISATDTGFSVHDLSTYPKLNEPRHAYAYIAYR